MLFANTYPFEDLTQMTSFWQTETCWNHIKKLELHFTRPV